MKNNDTLKTTSLALNMEPPNSLSLRAEQAVEANSNSLMWDVLTNVWDPSSNKDGYVNVGIAENTLMHDTLLDFIHNNVKLPAKYLTYNDGGSGSLRLRSAMSQFLNRHMNPIIPIQPDHLIVTNGVSSAIEHVSWAFTDPGEGILLGKPYYGTFIPDMTSRPRAEVVAVNFEDDDPFSLQAVTRYEEALIEFEKRTHKRVRALMLCHPHNPLGRCYPRETIIELMKLCQKYEIHLISDEIYALSVWENNIDTSPPPVKFESALAIDTSNIIDRKLVHVLWGMSKDFGANGIRVGVIISQTNLQLRAALQGATLYSYVSGLSDYVTANILQDTEFTDQYIRTNSQKLAESYSFVVQIIRSHNIEYAAGCNASFFLWVNLGKKYIECHPKDKLEEADQDITKIVMDRLVGKRVFLASGALFGSEKPGWFRIVFSHSREHLEEALRRIVAALEE